MSEFSVQELSPTDRIGITKEARSSKMPNQPPPLTPDKFSFGTPAKFSFGTPENQSPLIFRKFDSQFTTAGMDDTDECVSIAQPMHSTLNISKQMLPRNELDICKNKLDELEKYINYYTITNNDLDNWLKFGRKICGTIKKLGQNMKVYENGLSQQEKAWARIDKESDIENIIKGLALNTTIYNPNSVGFNNPRDTSMFLNTPRVRSRLGSYQSPDRGTPMENLSIMEKERSGGEEGKFVGTLSAMKHKTSVYRKAIARIEESLENYLDLKERAKQGYDGLKKTLEKKQDSLKTQSKRHFTSPALQRQFVEDVSDFERSVEDEIDRLGELKNMLASKFTDSRKGVVVQTIKYYHDLTSHHEDNNLALGANNPCGLGTASNNLSMTKSRGISGAKDD